MDFLTVLFLVGLGFFIGTIGTLIGAGGGFILVPVLLLLYPDMKAEVVTSISLGVIFLNALSGSFAYIRMKRVDFRSAIAFALATLPGAIIGAFTTEYIPRKIFNIILGILLLVIAFILFMRPHQGAFHLHARNGSVSRSLTDSTGAKYKYSFNIWTGIIFSFFVGFLSSLLGIGGGIIHVPVLTSLLNFPVHVATATSHLVLAIMSLAGTIVHIFQGHFKGEWLRTIYIGAGVVLGAQLGAFLSHKIKPVWIVRILSFALFLVGLRLLL